jgi:predicted RNA binding protein YcfA (HicA-like mRNA interferase family)
MKTISGKNFCKLLEKKGWVLARINGSHHVYTKQSTIFRISVPVHKNKRPEKRIAEVFDENCRN